ncbi:MAG: hypothetical protein ACKO2G_05840 [Verrucomicrobiales bacterium]
MRYSLLVSIFAITFTAQLPVAAQDADQAKAAIDAARKAAKDAGVEVPDVKKEDLDALLGKLADEVKKAQEKKEEGGEGEKDDPAKPVKPGEDPEAPSVRIEKLPDWIPAIEGFKPAGLGREWEGPVLTGKLKGTSPAKPAALVEAWAALDGKGFSAERNTRSSGGKVTRETVKLVSKSTADQWVEMQAEPGAEGEPTAVRVTYAQPAPKKAE